MNKPQFKKRTHRAIEKMGAVGKESKAAFAFFDECRQGRGVDIPDWPHWCYVPVAAAVTWILNKHGQDGMLVAPLSPGQLVCFAAWRMTKGIYRFDPALYDALIDTPLAGDIPVQVLEQLPEWCVYIETPGLEYAGETVFGAWVHIEYDIQSQRKELHIELDSDEGLLPIVLHCNAGSVEQSIKSSLEQIQRNADKQGVELDTDGMRSHWVAASQVIINLVLYICSEPEFMHKSQIDTPHNPQPKKTKKGWRLFQASGFKTWDVGVRIGAALRKAYQAEETGQTATGATVRPHVRRAHWHTFVSGKRLDKYGNPIAAADRKRELRWMPPLAVNVDDVDDLPAVIKPVK